VGEADSTPRRGAGNRTVFRRRHTPVGPTPGGKPRPGPSWSRRCPGSPAAKPGIGDDTAARQSPPRSSTTTATSWRRGRPTTAEQASGYLVAPTSRCRRCCAASGETPNGSGDVLVTVRRAGLVFAGDGARYGKEAARSGSWPHRRRHEQSPGTASPRADSRGRHSSGTRGWPRRAGSSAGPSDEQTGQAICAFVILKAVTPNATHRQDGRQLRKQVSPEISPIARPRKNPRGARAAQERAAGNIMRRLLRDVAEGRELATPRPWSTPGVFEAIQGQ